MKWDPIWGEIKEFELYGLFEGFALHCIVWGGNLGAGFQTFFNFYPYLGERIQFGEHIFQMCWFNHQLVI